MQIPRFLSISSHAIVNNHNCTIPSFQTNKSSHQAIFSTSNTHSRSLIVAPCNLLVGRRSFPYWVPVTFQGHLLLNFRWGKGAIFHQKLRAHLHIASPCKKNAELSVLEGECLQRRGRVSRHLRFQGPTVSDRSSTPWESTKIPPLMTQNPYSRYMAVSKNSGTPKWMVYNGKPY